MDPRGMYPDRWSLAFDLYKYVPLVVSVWGKPCKKPLHCWSDEDLAAIGNSLGRYMDRFEPK